MVLCSEVVFFFFFSIRVVAAICFCCVRESAVSYHGNACSQCKDLYPNVIVFSVFDVLLSGMKCLISCSVCYLRIGGLDFLWLVVALDFNWFVCRGWFLISKRGQLCILIWRNPTLELSAQGWVRGFYSH